MMARICSQYELETPGKHVDKPLKSLKMQYWRQYWIVQSHQLTLMRLVWDTTSIARHDMYSMSWGMLPAIKPSIHKLSCQCKFYDWLNWSTSLTSKRKTKLIYPWMPSRQRIFLCLVAVIIHKKRIPTLTRQWLKEKKFSQSYQLLSQWGSKTEENHLFFTVLKHEENMVYFIAKCQQSNEKHNDDIQDS